MVDGGLGGGNIGAEADFIGKPSLLVEIGPDRLLDDPGPVAVELGRETVDTRTGIVVQADGEIGLANHSVALRCRRQPKKRGGAAQGRVRRGPADSAWALWVFRRLSSRPGCCPFTRLMSRSLPSSGPLRPVQSRREVEV